MTDSFKVIEVDRKRLDRPVEDPRVVHIEVLVTTTSSIRRIEDEVVRMFGTLFNEQDFSVVVFSSRSV